MKVPYGVSPSVEAWVELPSGLVMAFPNADANPEGADYVRFVDGKGGEVAYWICDEWAESPVEVMGAICGAMKASKGPNEAKFYQVHPDAQFPPGIEFASYGD